LTLASGLRSVFGERVKVDFLDMSVYNLEPEALWDRLDGYAPDLVAVSALNIDAACSYRIAEIAREWDKKVVTALGGPLALRQADLVLNESVFDWVFEGPADRTFPVALERYFSGRSLGRDLPGFNYRSSDGAFVLNPGQDLIRDLDHVPLPAWDLVDFDRYRRHDRPRMIASVEERPYAFLFTSRGCPYLCNYCHDIFTKRFIYRSEDNVLEEMKLLYYQYGVREFHIVDDIFNLHKPRVQALMARIRDTFEEDIFIAFPNGLRGDILDQKTIDAMVSAGTYHAIISVETVTPRLQDLIEKYLDVEKAEWAINEFARQGVTVQGAFMLGFPTETPDEIEATIRYAVRSRLSLVHFFSVIPQPQTPIYSIAYNASPEATLKMADDERGMSYGAPKPWYYRAYNYDLEGKISFAYLRFYLTPWRIRRYLAIYESRIILSATLMVFLRFFKSIGQKTSALLAHPFSFSDKKLRDDQVR
jgi:radical SAM superfamily enzyme YgiQ (UPF0313 family)